MLLLFCTIFLLFTGPACSGEETSSQEDVSLDHEYRPEEEDDLPRVVVPIHYKLRLEPFLHEGTFQGQVEITIGCLESTDIVALHAHNDLEVFLAKTSVESVGEWQDMDARNSFSLHNERISYSAEHHLVKISKMRRYLYRDWCKIILEEELRKGMIYVLKLKFHGNLTSGEMGPFYRIKYLESGTEEQTWYVGTDFRNQNSRRVFPCFDELNLKATFKLSISRPVNFKAFSSTPCESTEIIDETGWAIDHFNITPPMIPESLAIIMFDPTSLKPVSPVQMWKSATVHGYAQSHLVDIFQSDMMYQIIRMLQVIEHHTGIPFPLPELYIMALPEYHRNEASDFWGLITFSEEELEAETVNYRLMQGIAKQWIGHLVTPHSRSKLGFNKGLSYYLTHIGLTYIEKNPKYANFVLWGPAFSGNIYYRYSEINVGDSENFRAIRTARLCQMLNFTLTEATFKVGLHNFLQERAFQTYTERHLFNVLDQQAWLDTTLPLFTSTYDMAKSWLRKDHFPVVTVTRNYVNNSAAIEQHTFIREWPYQTPDTMESLWWIPILYLSHHNLDHVLILTWLREERQINIGNLPNQETFIIINPEDVGMFLVNYDHTNWELLSEFLDRSLLMKETTLIPVNTRCKLFSDAIYLALSGELDFPTALDMTIFVRNDKEMSVWSTMLLLYENIYDELMHRPQDIVVLDKFGAYVAYLLIPAYESLQKESLEENGKKKMFNHLWAFLSHVGYKPALEESRSHRYTELIFNSSSRMKKSTFNTWQACSLFQWYDEEWELGLEKFLNMTNDDHRRTLISLLVYCTRKPELLDRIFNTVLLDGTIQLYDEDVRMALFSIRDYYTFIKFILRNWNSIKDQWGTNLVMWNLILKTATENFKTPFGFNMVSELYHSHKMDLGSAKRIVENSLYTVSEKMSGQYKFVRHMEAWLDQHLLFLSSQDIPSSQFLSVHIAY